MRWKWLGVITGVLGCSSITWAEVPLRDDAQGTLFGTDRFAVRIDARNGWLAEVLCDGQPVVMAPATAQAYDIRQDGAWVTGTGQAIERLGVERMSPDTIRSRTRAGTWTVDAYLQLDPERRTLRRWFDVTWYGASPTKIKNFWVRSGVLPLAESGRYLLPAQYPPRSVAASALTADRRTSSWRSPYVVIGENGRGWSVVWALDELQPYSDRGSTGVEEGRGEMRVSQSFAMQGHMRNGVTQRVGDTWLWIQPNDAETALRRLPEWFATVGQMPPEGRPDWLKRVILYSFHPGGTIGSDCRDLGGFSSATALLPHIDALGCNAIWLMPLEDKSIYWPRDYYKLQEGIGSPEDFKAFTARARSLGMRVWQDCVPHGGGNEFPRAKAHPEWLAQNEDGSTLSYWCFDFNWPTWIDYMRGVVSFYMREYGLDGFRIDACGGSKIPNWNPAIPYARASHAQAQGGFAMQRALREEVRKVKPDGANLAEVGASVHGAISDATYDFDLCYHVLHDFRRVPADVFVPRLRRWLHEQQYAEIPDLVRMRHVESHDSLRSGLWYGADAQRALVALLSWIHGIPMVYHEMEDGHYEAYRRIFHVRRHVPELNTGTADYLSVSAPAGVFACLRSGDRPARAGTAWHDEYAWDTRPDAAARVSIILVNLGGKAVTGKVSVPSASLPEALRGAAWARDLMNGGRVAVRDGACEVSLPAFGYTVLRLESAPLPPLAPVPEEAQPRPATERAGGPALRAGPLVADAKTGWARAWRTGWWRETPLRMDVALPAAWGRVSAVPARLTTVKDGVDAEYVWQGHTLAVQQRETDGGVEIRAAWPGGAPVEAALVIALDAARAWYADTAEGRFESPFRVRHPGMSMQGVVGPIYRLPQGGAVLWDSRRHPFGLDAAHARVGVRLPDGRDLSLTFDPARLPASVRLLDRVGDRHGLHVAVMWRGDESGVAWGVDDLRIQIRSARGRDAASAGCGDPRLTAVGGGWQFENAHYRVRISRAGTLAGFWRRDGEGWQTVVRADGLYTDRGFARDGERMAQENDVEASVRIEPSEANGVRLSVTGELRGFGRFDKLGRPVRFCSVFTLGEGPAFRRLTAFQSTTVPAAVRAFLSQRTVFEGASGAMFRDAAGVILSREANRSQARTCETAKAEDPLRLPDDVRIACGDGAAVRLADLKWIGTRPGNVFLHGEDLHLAWLDGASGKVRPGVWHGVSMSVSCGDDVAAARGEARGIAACSASADVVQDGGFDEYEAAGGMLRLVQSGGGWPTERAASQVSWRLPEGCVGVREGDNPCLRIEGDGVSYRLIRQTLLPQAFLPGETWRLTARMRAEAVQKGDVDWKTACLRWCVEAEGRVSYHSVSLPEGDSAWREYSVPVTLPQQFDGIAVEAGLNGNRGRVWIDDVRVTKVK
ncbi:MAG TPA: alpha-amylase family glycosyl hydrolase [Kiritimatiellia bacterium]|nr:alpha-amylase family glycosyl hydrolase [Kiritimatiellia bacterium]HRU71329.1 alpha-amylase family glycosyl hydrolase [Kiritimatiellia bacterium]